VARFRTLDTLAPMDDDVCALMADIDASLADLEQKLEDQRSEDRSADASAHSSTHSLNSLPVDQPGQAVGSGEGTKAPVAEPTSHDPGGFLAELEQEARAAAGASEGHGHDHAAKARLIHEALGRIFQFFNMFCRYTNALAPTVGRAYRLDAQTAYTDLKWRGAAARSRRQSLAENALLEYVAFRVSLLAPAPITVIRRWDQMEILQKEMHILDLRPAEGIDIDDEAAQGQVSLRLAPDLPVQVTFRANYERNRIDLLSRNLEGFGIAAFTCHAGDVTQQFLDDFGRYLLARTVKLPVALHRVHCRAEL
jgi:hypothetical protein